MEYFLATLLYSTERQTKVYALNKWKKLKSLKHTIQKTKPQPHEPQKINIDIRPHHGRKTITRVVATTAATKQCATKLEKKKE